ncbi:MAG TPA: hypothetical protein PLV42_11720 [bacterium]|nr:hypothetical protein [bacterium]
MKWIIILLVAFLAAYFLWIKGHIDQALPEKLVPMMAKDTDGGAKPETPDAAAPVDTSFKMNNVNPDLKAAVKVYTADDVQKINEKTEKNSSQKNTFTNADLKKYKERPGRPDTEKVKKEIKWAEEPAPKKSSSESVR